MNSTEPVLNGAMPGRLLYSGPARLLSMLAAGLFALGIIIFPQLVIEHGQAPHHGALLLGLWGMAAGFVHGVGFVPRRVILRLALGPIAAWFLLVCGFVLMRSL